MNINEEGLLSENNNNDNNTQTENNFHLDEIKEDISENDVISEKN
jgi:hypothetical protein